MFQNDFFEKIFENIYVDVFYLQKIVQFSFIYLFTYNKIKKYNIYMQFICHTEDKTSFLHKIFVNRYIERKCKDTLWMGVSFYFYKNQ